jgi:hypothetical protein
MKGMNTPSRILAIASVLLLVGQGCNIFATQPPPMPSLTRDEALVVLKENIRDCEEQGVPEQYRSCTLLTLRVDDGYLVTVTHDGYFDDSVKASRVEAKLTWQDGAWVKSGIAVTYQCWPGRGHQEFTADLCV